MVERGGVAPPGCARAEPPVALLWMRRLVLVAAALMLAGSVGMLGLWRQADAAVQRYLSSPCTASPGPGCSNVKQATVLGMRVFRDGGANLHAEVDVRVGGMAGPLDVVWPNDVFWALRPGEHVVLIYADGAPATIRLDPDPAHPSGQRLWTTSNPQVDGDLALWAAGMLASTALVAIVLTARRPMPGRRRWSILAALRDQRLRLVMLVFVLAQLLDVISSTAGHHGVLYEGATLTRAVVDHWGDAGFLAVKVPAVMATLLAVARLPRRIGVPVMWAATSAMLVVVAENVRLLSQGGY